MSQSFANSLSWMAKSRNLAETFDRAFDYAKIQSHRLVTLEHLLLALVTDQDAAAVLQACNVDLNRLGSDLTGHLTALPDRLVPGDPAEPAVSPEMLRILQYAAAAAQQSRRKEISGAIVLAAIVGDGRSPAADMLRQQGLTFEETIRALQRAIATSRGASTVAAETALAPVNPQGSAVQAPRHEAPPPQRHVNGATAQSTEELLAAARRRVGAAAAVERHGIRQPEPPEAGASYQAGHAVADHTGSEDLPSAADGPVEPGPPPLDHHRDADPAPLPPPGPVRQNSPPPAPASPVGAPGSGPPPDHWGQPVQPSHEPHSPHDYRPAAPPARATPPPSPSSPHPEVTYRHDPGPYRPTPAPAPVPRASPANAPPETDFPAYAGRAEPGQARDDEAREGRPPRRSRRSGRRETGEPHQRGGSLSAGQLVENIPRAMTVGRPETVEVRIAKSDVSALAEGLQGVGAVYRHDLIVTKAMSVRLRAPDGGFWIETVSPETQWIENMLGQDWDDFASWRWTITPQRSGRARLQLVVSARTVGTDGLAAETALPDRVINVKVRVNFGRVAAQWGGWIAAAVLGGVLARFGEGVWDFAQIIIGGAGGG